MTNTERIVGQASSPRAWQEEWLDRFYRCRPGWVDGTTEFHRFCEERIPLGSAVLEVGAGPENQTTRFLASHYRLAGLDPDPAVLKNSLLNDARVLEDREFPFASSSFDAVVSNYVIEHVERPEEHLREIHRVLRPGGCYLFRTPNLFHYVSAVARLTPHWVHEVASNRLRRLHEGDHDPYSTFHKMNTPGAIRRHAAIAGLDVHDLVLIEKEPSYGVLARPIFLLFMGYERLVNSTAFLARFRANILSALLKRTS